MSSEYTVWFAAHKDEFSLASISEEEFSTFEQFLGSQVSAATAARQLLSGRTPTDNDKIRRQVFALVVALAQFFPDAHLQLVEISKELFSESQLDRQPFVWDLRDAHDGLEAQITEVLKSSSSTAKPAGNTSSLLQSRWVNFHIFNAKSCAAGTINVGPRFLILAAERSLEAKSPSFLQLQFYSPAAAAWLAYAAPAVLALCRTNSSSGWREAPPGDRLWKGKEGFSEGRWAFWKTRVEELRTQGEMDEETGALMRQAFVAMEKAKRVKNGKS